jgi:hypothetical protein
MVQVLRTVHELYGRNSSDDFLFIFLVGMVLLAALASLVQQQLAYACNAHNPVGRQLPGRFRQGG